MDKYTKIMRLHNVDDNSPVIINSSEILYVNQQHFSSELHTTIGFVSHYNSDSPDTYTVNESVDKIYSMLKNCGFVRCHRADDNCIELFNIDKFITAGINDEDEKYVELYNEINMIVNESPETIMNLVITAQKEKYGSTEET